MDKQQKNAFLDLILQNKLLAKATGLEATMRDRIVEAVATVEAANKEQRSLREKTRENAEAGMKAARNAEALTDVLVSVYENDSAVMKAIDGYLSAIAEAEAAEVQATVKTHNARAAKPPA